MIEHYSDLHKDEVLFMLKHNCKGKTPVFKQQRRLFELFPETGLLIKDEHGTLVGCAHYKKDKKRPKNNEIYNFAFNDDKFLHYYLNLVYVLPEHRLKGHAKELLAYLEFMAGTKDIPKIAFGSEKDNTAANSLFLKAGYISKEVKALNGASYLFWKKDIKKRSIGAGFKAEWQSQNRK